MSHRDKMNEEVEKLLSIIGDDETLLDDLIIMGKLKIKIQENYDEKFIDDLSSMSRLKIKAQGNSSVNFSASDWMSTSQEVKQAIKNMLDGQDFTTTAEQWFNTPQNIKKIVAYINKKAPDITGQYIYFSD